jgi:hypothetical protein
MLAATSAALAMFELRAAHAGCTMDMECKGARICENGGCVYPPPVDTGPGPTEAALPGATSTSAEPPAGFPQSTVPPVGTPAMPPTGATAVPSGSGAAPDAHREAPRAFGVQPSQRFLVEVSGFGFRIDDGKAGAFGGGVEAGYRLWRWLGIGAWLEGSGQRSQPTAPGSPVYRLYDLGLGLTIGKTVGPFLADVSVLPQLTLLTVKASNVVSGEDVHQSGPESMTRWGAAADARLRVGFLLGPWCPFILVAGSYALRAASFRVYESHVYNGSTTLPRATMSLGLGLAYLFGASPQSN